MTLSFAISAFIAGLLIFFAPCTFPLVPGYLGFISGVSLQELNNSIKGKQERRKIIINALYFVVDFSCVFIIFGALAGFIGLAIVSFRIWLERIGGVFVILFGLFMIGAVSIPFLDREKRLRIPSFFTRGRPLNSLDLLPYNLSAAISIFRLRLCKNYSTYTPYMLHNFCFAVPEI